MAPSSCPSSRWSRGSKPSAAKSRGVPTVSSTDEVVLAALGRLRRRGVGQRAQQRRRTPAAASLCAASASLTCALSCLGLGQQRLLLVALGLARSACRRSSAPPAPSRTPRSTTGGARRRRRARRRSSVGSPRRRWAARRASGSSRRSRGSITAASLSTASSGRPSAPIPYAGSTLPPTERVSPLSFDLRRAEPTAPGPVLVGDRRAGRLWVAPRDPRRHRTPALQRPRRPGRRAGATTSARLRGARRRSPTLVRRASSQLDGRRASCSPSPAYAAWRRERRVAGWIVAQRRAS